jgi:hypothetical protein
MVTKTRNTSKQLLNPSKISSLVLLGSLLVNCAVTAPLEVAGQLGLFIPQLSFILAGATTFDDGTSIGNLCPETHGRFVACNLQSAGDK